VTRPIVFTVDRRYVRPLAVALESLRRTCSQPRTVVVVHDGLGPRHQQRLSRWLAGSRLELDFLEIAAPLRNKWLPHHFTPASLLRLVMVEQLPFEEMIYVDSDVIFLRDPSVLDEVNLGEASLAGVPWQFARDLRPNGFGVIEPYFASSLLIVDRMRFLGDQIGQCCVGLIEAHAFEFPDQDALNLCCGAWRVLERSLCVELNPLGSRLPQLSEEVVLLQLSGADKPWHLMSGHPAAALWKSYLAVTPYRNAMPGMGDLRWRGVASRLRQRLLAWLKSVMAAAQSWAWGCRRKSSSTKR
jgi:lipopolysaccharide biosynthesis glycosyltransferase